MVMEKYMIMAVPVAAVFLSVSGCGMREPDFDAYHQLSGR